MSYTFSRNGASMGTFETEDAAWNTAQDAGLLRAAREDEGGGSFAVPIDGVEIRRSSLVAAAALLR